MIKINDMVTLIKIENNQKDVNVTSIFGGFEDVYGFDASDRMLVNESEDGLYEHIYLFLNAYEVSGLINLFLENGVTIYSKSDVTDKIIEIINKNKIDEFKSNFGSDYDFDELIKEFSINHITTDMVLEKITNLGISSLTKTDYIILK